ncbi:MAG: bifunctional glutamine synthetase adenylyltransferase/deadenyltransferase, partial [Lautropia sp.]
MPPAATGDRPPSDAGDPPQSSADRPAPGQFDPQACAAARYSGYFRRSATAIAARPDALRTALLSDLQALIAAPLVPAAIDAAWARRLAAGEAPEVALRRFRMLLMMALIERDVTQQAPLAEVVTAISHWAQLAVRHALAVAAAEFAAAGRELQGDDGRPQDLLVVGMGKLGGAELNVSSDIDLVFVCRDQGPQPQATERLARRMVNLLAQTTEDGYVFRVDVRLRPYGDSGPLIASLGMLEQYFYEQGREWERFAWFKGRVIADSGLAPRDTTDADIQGLMQLITPFVFRRYLDYPAFASLSRLHDLIRSEARKNETRRERSDNAGWDVKLGRGGIREIEFSAQLFQIVRGGQDPVLRERSTPQALERLAQRRLLEPQTVEALIAAWTLLRRTEHALQYLEDEQTHWLPDAPEKRATIAAMLGLAPDQFDARLRTARDAVTAVFDKLLAPARRDANRAAEIAAGGVGDAARAAAGTAGTATAPVFDADCQSRVDALRESRRFRMAS